MSQESKPKFPVFELFLEKIFAPLLITIAAIVAGNHINSGNQENQIMESYFRDMNTLVTSEFAYDNLADKCLNLDQSSTKYKANNCDEHKSYSPQTDLIRNTAGARTILVLNELTDKNKKIKSRSLLKK